MKKLSTLILMGILTLGNASFAQQAVIFHTGYNNLLASAAFESSSTDGCIVTDVIVKTGQTFQRDGGGGKPLNDAFTSILVQVVDYCNFQYLFYGVADTYLGTGGDVASNLTAANIDATIPVLDQVNNVITNVHIVINWKSTSGMTTHQFTNSHFNLKGLHFGTVSHGIYRDADASGSVTIDGGDNLIADAGYFNYIIRGGVDEIINLHPARMAQPDASQGMVENSVSFYPNPASDVLYINTANVSHYSVVNMLGAVIAEHNVAGTTTEELNLGNIVPGMYFLRLQTTDGEVVEKFVRE